jgi:hypothetical protein
MRSAKHRGISSTIKIIEKLENCMSESESRRFLLIPDTQIRPGVPLEHLDWLGQAIVDYMPDVLVHIGDHWDMPSLSKWESPGSAYMEGARVINDIDAGNEAWDRITAPMEKEIARREHGHMKRWNPDCHFFMGNHEDRISRAIKAEPKLDGILSLDKLEIPNRWEVHPFLEMVDLDGIQFSHYFSNVGSGKPIGGSIDNRLNRIGKSFVQGHQQGLLYGIRQFPGNLARHGLVAGSFYLHDEHYRDAQSNGEWRGIVVLNEVRDGGNYDVMPLSMNYLRRRYS